MKASARDFQQNRLFTVRDFYGTQSCTVMHRYAIEATDAPNYLYKKSIIYKPILSLIMPGSVVQFHP